MEKTTNLQIGVPVICVNAKGSQYIVEGVRGTVRDLRACCKCGAIAVCLDIQYQKSMTESPYLKCPCGHLNKKIDNRVAFNPKRFQTLAEWCLAGQSVREMMEEFKISMYDGSK